MRLNHHQRGMTLIELIVAIFIVTILVSAIFVLIKNYRNTSNQTVSDINTDAYVNNFLQTFTEEISHSGHQPIDSTLSAITLNGKVLNFAYSGGSLVSQVAIASDLDQYTRQTLTYQLSPTLRDSQHPNELAFIKTKQLSNGTSTENVFVNEIALAGIDSFSCVESLNLSPLNPNAALRGVDCTLVVYGAKGFNKLNTYKFYANTDNQF
jgi:prepilin-type N-terminal cleavage/methylation domain-containing protein